MNSRDLCAGGWMTLAYDPPRYEYSCACLQCIYIVSVLCSISCLTTIISCLDIHPR
jgi:hypothetical protein